MFLLTLCIALKLTRSFALVWRKWLPWLTGRAGRGQLHNDFDTLDIRRTAFGLLCMDLAAVGSL